ncbi:FeoA family protein [Fusobacterium sp.]|uniref:FeoA family protein n=1 Tax=Fusobacterium sp. TaxID=68766 RepID=UPI00260B839D|nr:FeoA family protein [Fusobacterium sp.]
MVVPLAFAEQNKYFTIKNINSSSREKITLAEKGICTGNKICLIKNTSDNFIVKIGQCQYVIGFGFARNIMVEC